MAVTELLLISLEAAKHTLVEVAEQLGVGL